MPERTGPKPKHWTELYQPEPNSGCWLWLGALTHGRATVTYQTNGRRKVYGVSRLAWQEVKAPIPDGLWVLHRCDNGACVNPDHLYLGTHKDNMRDMVRHGKRRRVQRTHCPRGHRYDLRYSYPEHGQFTHQVCSVCNREKCSVFYQKRKARLLAEAVK